MSLENCQSKSVCYILPFYAPDDDSHFSHVPRLLSQLAYYCKVYVIVEKSRVHPDIPNTEIHVQRYGFGPRLLRMIELAFLVFRLYRRGCRKFFVRISVTAALTIGVLAKLLSIKMYYWNSGQGRNILPRWTDGIQGFTRRARAELAYLPFYIATKLAYRFVTGPELMGDYYAKEYGISSRKLIILYNDIDLTRFVPVQGKNRAGIVSIADRSPQNNVVILFVHRLSIRKGPQHLVPLASKLAKVSDNFVFLVVGDGPYRGQLLQEIHSRGLDEKVLIRGAVPNRQLPEYYRGADIFILPSEEEGFPRVLLEAMASGLPVVAFDVGGVRDILGARQQNFVVPRGDIDGFAERLLTLLRDPSLRDELARENLERVQRFSTKRVAQMFVERIVFERERC